MKKNNWRHHLQRKVIQKIKRFGGLGGPKNPKPSPGGKSVFIHII